MCYICEECGYVFTEEEMEIVEIKNNVSEECCPYCGSSSLEGF